MQKTIFNLFCNAKLIFSFKIASVSPSFLLSECPIKVYLAPTLFNMNGLIAAVSEENFNISRNNLISVIIGGDNKHYKFNNNEVKKLNHQIIKIKEKNPNFNILILTSRRTNDHIKKILYKKLNKIAYVWQENEINPYTFALKYSKFFIVTSDSTSMISECAFTGKPIYVFHLPFKRESKRMYKFHQEFEEKKITKKLDNQNNLVPWTYDSLNESKRIASILKERIIKEINESR